MRSVAIICLGSVLALASCQQTVDSDAEPPELALPQPDASGTYFLWTPEEQLVGYRNIEKIFDTHTIAAGGTARTLPNGRTEYWLRLTTTLPRAGRSAREKELEASVSCFTTGLDKCPMTTTGTGCRAVRIDEVLRPSSTHVTCSHGWRSSENLICSSVPEPPRPPGPPVLRWW